MDKKTPEEKHFIATIRSINPLNKTTDEIRRLLFPNTLISNQRVYYYLIKHKIKWKRKKMRRLHVPIMWKSTDIHIKHRIQQDKIKKKEELDKLRKFIESVKPYKNRRKHLPEDLR